MCANIGKTLIKIVNLWYNICSFKDILNDGTIPLEIILKEGKY